MTDLQKTEYEILKETLSVCEQLGIPYFLLCGSALGAVKYQGFIPWDDDVDIGMFRQDYDRFLNEAQEILPPHLFLQNYKTDPAFPAIFSKIRDSRTTYIERSAKDLPIHHGVYIDVFPLDGYPEDVQEQRRLERRKQWYKLQLDSVYGGEKSWKRKVLDSAFYLIGSHRRTTLILEQYEKMISTYDAASSHVICNHGNWQGKLEYAPRGQYGQGVFVEFEGLSVRVPEQYDAYLTQKYGNWRADLPPEEQVGHHFYEILDLARPYTEYKRST